MTLPTHRWQRGVLLATMVVFVGLAVSIYGFRFFAWMESDATVPALLAAKVLHAHSPIVANWYYANGDIWVLGPHLLAVLPVAAVGLGPESLWIGVVAGFVLELVVLYKVYTRLGDGARWVGAFAAVVTLLPWSGAHVAFVYIQLSYGFLTTLYLVAFGAFGSLLGARRRRAWVFAGAFLALLVVQNPTRGLVFTVAPLAVGCAWLWRDVPRRRKLALLLVALAAWAVAFVAYRLLASHGVTFSRPRGHLDFAVQGVAGVAGNLGRLGRGLLMLCGGGDSPSLRAVPGLLVLIGACVLVGREVVASRAASTLRFVCVVIVAQLAASLVPLVIGNLLVSDSSVRYLLPSLLAIFGLAAVLAARAAAGGHGRLRVLAMSWMIVVPVAAVVAIPETSPPTPDKAAWPDVPELEKIAAELARRGLTHGFSDVLAANALTLEQRGAGLTCPVFFRDFVIPQRWLTDTTCYTPATMPPRFYVITPRDDHDRVSLGATLPAPVDRFSVGPSYEVAVFVSSKATLAWLDLPLPDDDPTAFPIQIAATHLQLRRGKVALDDTGHLVATGETGFVLYGPYITLPRGRYDVRWSGHGIASPGRLKFLATADSGGEVLTTVTVPTEQVAGAPGELAHLTFRLGRSRQAIELSVYSEDGARVELDSLSIARR